MVPRNRYARDISDASRFDLLLAFQDQASYNDIVPLFHDSGPGRMVVGQVHAGILWIVDP